MNTDRGLPLQGVGSLSPSRKASGASVVDAWVQILGDARKDAKLQAHWPGGESRSGRDLPRKPGLQSESVAGDRFVKALQVEEFPKRRNLIESLPVGDREILSEPAFKRSIAVERKRSERSREPFLLMLVEIGSNPRARENQKVLERMVSVLRASSRETDVIGWYKHEEILGLTFTGLLVTDKSLILTTILTRVSDMLRHELTFEQFNRVSLSFHFFPDDWGQGSSDGSSNTALYPDLINPGTRKQGLLMLKRAIDATASGVGLLLLAPLFLIVAAAIKLTSQGPVFFRQQRVGQYGKQFMIFKFRSMYANNDHAVHKDYVLKLIANQAERSGGTAAAPASTS